MSERVQTHAKPAVAPAPRFTRAPSRVLQRKCACGGSSSSGSECPECQKKALTLQRYAAGRHEPATVPPIVYDVLNSPGQPLDGATRAFFEPRFGHDFSKVRVHTDGKAAESASAVNAEAYTLGRDIVFSRRSYAPWNPAGRRLLAHELAHVAQQGSRPIDGTAPISIGGANSSLEGEADRAEGLAIAGGKTRAARVGASPGASAKGAAIQRRCGCGCHAGAYSPSSMGQVPMAFQGGFSEPALSQLTGLFAGELVATLRDLRGGVQPRETSPLQQRPRRTPGQPASRQAAVSQAEVERVGTAWGARISEAIMGPRSEAARNALGAGPLANGSGSASISEARRSTSGASPAPDGRLAAVDDPGDSDDPTLGAIVGETRCVLPLGVPIITLMTLKCTAGCILLHESTHFWDIAPCCARAGVAWRAAAGPGRAAVATTWVSWINTNRDFFECRAYRVTQTCCSALDKIALCFAPKSVVKGLLIGAGAVAGALIGSQVLGGAGAAVGGATGLAGGPASPVTVPAGATAGFISGELLGFVGGAVLGGLAGAAAEELRRKCCEDVANQQRTNAKKITEHCPTAGPALTPCPF